MKKLTKQRGSDRMAIPRPARAMKTTLIAPCGMNCNICYAHLRDSNKCPGCRLFNADVPVSIAGCKIKTCQCIRNNSVKFCFECDDFPCKNLKRLDKRYRAKYCMSEIENLEYIRENGIRKFVKNEQSRWSCSACGGMINVHTQACSDCAKNHP